MSLYPAFGPLFPSQKDSGPSLLLPGHGLGPNPPAQPPAPLWCSTGPTPTSQAGLFPVLSPALVSVTHNAPEAWSPQPRIWARGR